MRDSLGMGGFFLTFHTCKKALAKHRYEDGVEAAAERPPDFDHLLLAGAASGFCFWLGEEGRTSRWLSVCRTLHSVVRRNLTRGSRGHHITGTAQPLSQKHQDAFVGPQQAFTVVFDLTCP